MCVCVRARAREYVRCIVYLMDVILREYFAVTFSLVSVMAYYNVVFWFVIAV